AEGQWLRDVRIVMLSPAAISGSVIDDQGLPIVGAFVRVLARISIAGRSRIASGRVARTDDRGVYRISGIEPGDYYIQVPSVQAAFPAALSTDKLLGRPDEQ